MEHSISIDPEEIAHFSKLADRWWDERGPFRPLHRMNPVRLAFLRQAAIAHFSKDTDALAPLTGLNLLDIGCGGGLIAEPMARLGADVTGIDAAEKNIGTAAVHARQSGLTIDYRHATAEGLAEKGERFDIVLALEVVEHVADVEAFVASIAQLLKPGGIAVMSTLNRTVKSYLLGIVAAEYILRWLPKGTHDWKKFLKPSELVAPLRANGLVMKNLRGFAYDPIKDDWNETSDVSMNYILVAEKPLPQQGV